VGTPLQKPPSSALSLPCEIVSISQSRPLLASEFTTSGQEEAGKGLKIPVCGGSSLHATPFRQEAAVHWMPMGRESPFPCPCGPGIGALSFAFSCLSWPPALTMGPRVGPVEYEIFHRAGKGEIYTSPAGTGERCSENVPTNGAYTPKTERTVISCPLRRDSQPYC
jgi:hypothetical protein